jgi:hypothetical protein
MLQWSEGELLVFVFSFFHLELLEDLCILNE